MERSSCRLSSDDFFISNLIAVKAFHSAPQHSSCHDKPPATPKSDYHRSDNGASTNNRAEQRYSLQAVLRCACQHQWIDDAADDYVVCIHSGPECQWLMKIAHGALYTLHHTYDGSDR
jgi:hypothetical protein